MKTNHTKDEQNEVRGIEEFKEAIKDFPIDDLTRNSILWVHEKAVQHLQERHEAEKLKLMKKHFAWCPQCGDALEQYGTKNKYNCFGCNTNYQLRNKV